MSFFTRAHLVLPVPQYLTLPSVGVDISDTSLKYIQFAPGQYGLRLTQWGDIDIKPETVTRGALLKPQQLTEALVEMRTRTNTSYVRISLPEERAYLFETEVKRNLSYKEIRGALEFRLEENVPLSPRDAFFDYEVIETTDASAPLKVSVTVYARETIMGYYEAALAAGLIPLSFEVEAAAIARASLPVHDTGTHMIIDFGKTRTGVGIVHRGSLMYTSTIDIGGKELSAALRAELGDMPESELTTLKNTIGLLPSIEQPLVSRILQTEMQSIITELKMRIQYWNSHTSALPEHAIRSVVLCGGSSNLKGLPGFIANQTGIEANRSAVWSNAFSLDDQLPPIDIRHSYGYATAIGLALAGHIKFYD